MSIDVIAVSPVARAALLVALAEGDEKGEIEYGQPLTTRTDIDAYSYGIAELVDAARTAPPGRRS